MINACQQYIRQACPGTILMAAPCMREIANDVHGQPTHSDAQLVLIRAGCPEPMVRAHNAPATFATPTGTTPAASSGSVVGRARTARVRVESDEFTGESRHVFEYDFGRGRGLSIAWVTGNVYVTARIDARSPRAQFAECHETRGLAGEERITPEEVGYESEPFGVGVLEHVSFRLTPRDLHAMVSSDRVRFRVCSTVFELPGNTEALRAFYATIYEAAAEARPFAEQDAGVDGT